MDAPADASAETERSRVDRAGWAGERCDMKEGPDFTRIAALLGDPARANMLCALMSGKALTAGELAREAGIVAATASGHLAQLETAGLVVARRSGRYRYFALAGPDVAHALETLTGLAAMQGHLRTRTGPRDADMREARICYDHLAGSVAVRIFESISRRGLLRLAEDRVDVTAEGAAFFTELGLPVETLLAARRPLCRICLDWSERRNHLAGSLGAALLQHMRDREWVRAGRERRVLHLTGAGMRAIDELFPSEADA